MEIVTIKNLKDFEGQEVKSMDGSIIEEALGKYGFDFEDGTGLLQCVVVDGECDLESFHWSRI